MTDSPTWDTLLALLRGEATPPIDSVDWAAVWVAAESHRITAAIGQEIQARELSLPAELRVGMEQSRLAWSVKRRAYIATVQRLGELSISASIPLLLFKGPVVADRLYASPEARIFRDLDVAVGAADFPRWLELLSAAGFLQVPGPYQSVRTDTLVRWELPITLVHREAPGLQVDLHLNPVHQFEPYHLPAPNYFSRSVPWSFGLRRPCDEDLLLLLFIHAVKHGYFQLVSFLDLHRAYLDPSLDECLPTVRSRAAEAGFESLVLVVAEVVRRLFGRGWPELPAPPFRGRLAALMICRALKSGGHFLGERPQVLLNAFLLVDSGRRLARYLGLSLFRPPSAIPDRPYLSGGWTNPWAGLVRAARRVRRDLP